MQTYKYHAETKEYLYAEEAFLDPLETEQQGTPIYLLPADSTFDAPPAVKPGYAAVWNGAAWELVEDHRQKHDKGGVPVEGTGTPFWMPDDTWQTPARYMKELGKLPEGAMLKAPDKPFEAWRDDKLSELNLLFSSVETDAWVNSSLGFKADANTTANTNIEGLIKSMTALGQETVIFCDYDNIYRKVTLEELHTLQLEVIQNGQSLYAQKWAFRNAINEAKVKEELDAVQISFNMLDFNKVS